MELRICTIKQNDGTVWYGVEEVRKHDWGNTVHPVRYKGKLLRMESAEHFKYEDETE